MKKTKRQMHKELQDNKALKQCAQQFGLVGDLTRMKICWLLCKYPELSVGEISDILNVSNSVVSHSLKKLRQHNLVNSRREHKKIFYSLAKTNFNQILKSNFRNI